MSFLYAQSQTLKLNPCKRFFEKYAKKRYHYLQKRFKKYLECAHKTFLHILLIFTRQILMQIFLFWSFRVFCLLPLILMYREQLPSTPIAMEK